jgi:choline dehydrogenase-like flavoprotein
MARVIEGEWDYIVCGAGTAGCLMANRLSANPKNRVLLLEAGTKDDWIWFHIPVGYLFAINNPRADWMFRTEAEPGLNGRSLIYPRGKVMGGSSAINAMITMRGQSADYDHWRQLGLTGWGWDDVKPVFRKLEDHFLGDSEHHGTGGEWRVEAPRVRWDLLDRVREAAVQMGVRPLDDFNTGDNEGTAYFHVNQKKGLRWSSARGFIKPIIDERDNLDLLSGVLVEKVIVENGRATGVQFRQGGESRIARCRGEVVLTAGSIGSTQILELSGIGHGDVLARHGIPVVKEKPGVGGNLQDHLQIRAIYKVQGIKTLNETYHNLFKPLSLDKFGDPLHRFPAVTVAPCNLRPTSRGSIHIRSADPADKPVIAPNYLATDEDRQVAADSLRVTRRLMSQPALAPYRPEEHLPGPVIGDDAASLAKAAGDIGTTIFHPVGTAKMGLASDPMAVVDERLRVIGIDGLRVADASVMPTITSGNTNTPTLMIAEKGARMILEDARG